MDRRRGLSQTRGGWRRGVGTRSLFVLDTRRVTRCSKAYPDPLNPGADALLTTLERPAAPDGRRREG